MERQYPRIVQAGFAQFRESGQQAHRPLDLAEKIIHSDEGAYAGVPFNSGISLCLAAKAEGKRPWQH